jgi:peroxiredoxin
MKQLKLVALFISVMSFSFAQNETNRGYKVKLGDQLPEITLTMLNGEKWTNKDFKNKVVVIQFTGSWCGVCKKEMPQLEKRVWQKFKDEDFLLIGVDIKDTKERAEAFVKSTAITYPVAHDPKAYIFSQFTLDGAGVTRNIVVNKAGEIVFLTRLFEEKEFEEMIAKIKLLI